MERSQVLSSQIPFGEVPSSICLRLSSGLKDPMNGGLSPLISLQARSEKDVTSRQSLSSILP